MYVCVLTEFFFVRFFFFFLGLEQISKINQKLLNSTSAQSRTLAFEVPL